MSDGSRTTSSNARRSQGISGLVHSAEDLAAERSAVDDLIRRWNEKIDALGLNVETWVNAGGSDPSTGIPAELSTGSAIELGYRDGLVVRFRDRDGCRIARLAEIDYGARIEALALLPRLLEDVKLLVDGEVERLRRLKAAAGFDTLKERLCSPFLDRASARYLAG